MTTVKGEAPARDLQRIKIRIGPNEDLKISGRTAPGGRTILGFALSRDSHLVRSATMLCGPESGAATALSEIREVVTIMVKAARR